MAAASVPEGSTPYCAARSSPNRAEMNAADPVDAQSQARRLSESLALAFQATLMVRHAPAPSAEAFIAARLGEDRAAQYGALPPGTDAAAIAARH